MKTFAKNNCMQCVNIIMIIYVMIKIFEFANQIPTSFSINSNFNYTEFLINYQGGFVRRGLLGEWLYWLATTWHVNVRYVIGTIIWLSMLLVLFFLIRQVKRHNISWWIIPLNCTFCGADFIRKDYLCMLFIIAIIFILDKDTINRWVRYVVITLLCIILWNIHEAFFFVIGPFVSYYMVFKDKAFKSLAVRIAMQLPIWGMFLVLLYCHGNIETAIAVQASWHKLYPSDIPAISEGDCYFFSEARNAITALAWDTKNTIATHLQLVYGDGYSAIAIPQPDGIFVMPFLYFAVFYLISRYIYVYAGEHSEFKDKSSNAFSLLLVFLFISMSPLFCGLSCDTSRLFMYWTLTALSILFIFGQEKVDNLFPVQIRHYSEKVNLLIDKYIPPTPLLLVLIILFLGIPRDHYNIMHLAYGVIAQIAHTAYTIFEMLIK